MKYQAFVASLCMAWAGILAHGEIVSQSKEVVILEPSELPEIAQSAGQSIELHRLGNGKTYLYVEQFQLRRLAILDVTEPSRIKPIGFVKLDVSAPFDFVRDLDSSTALICFRDDKGAAIVDLRKPSAPTLSMADALRQAAHTEEIGFTGILMVNEPRRDGDVPARDFQIVDTSDPRSPRLLKTVSQVQKKLNDEETGTVYLVGAEGITAVRRPQVEERHKRDASYTN
jgi:LVIVD repeat-containing protein